MTPKDKLIAKIQIVFMLTRSNQNLTNQVSPSGRALLEKLTSQASQEITCLLWYLKVHYHVQKNPATGPYPEPHEFSPHPYILFLQDPF
jgi:hypothetical protein